MDLSDVYSQRVKQSSIPLTGLPSTVKAPTIIRDPQADAFQRNVFAQLQSVIPDEPIQTRDIPQAPSITHVSFEDALRELATMNK